MHVVHLSLGFARSESASAFLDRVPALTRLCEETARLPETRVTVLCRFDRDEDVVRNGVAFHFRVDDPRLLLAGRRTVSAALLRLARDLRPDVVHLHGLLFPLQAALVRFRLGRGAALAVQHHGERPQGRLHPALQRLLFRAADGFLFTARDVADEWVDAGVLRPDWPIHEVVEASTDFGPTTRATASERAQLPGSPAVIWVGRLHMKKDPTTALQGFAKALERLPDAHLTMVYREAPLLPDVEAILERSPLLASRVHLAGEVPHAGLERLFGVADLFLTSSPAEGSNFALIEALACGTPAVASDIPAHRAITGDGAVGSLFRAGDAEACAGALVSAASRLGGDARAAVRRRFDEYLSWPAVARQAVAAYEALRAGRTGGAAGPGRTAPEPARR